VRDLYRTNYAATKLAIARAILGEPTIDQLIANRHIIKHVMFDPGRLNRSDGPSQAKKKPSLRLGFESTTIGGDRRGVWTWSKLVVPRRQGVACAVTGYLALCSLRKQNSGQKVKQ
jgi:hypothetical protein